jgi:hypothetical protein
MCESARQIENLMYRYCELMDTGDFAGVARLFEHADHISSSGYKVRGSEAALAYFERRTRRFEETGTPRTKHLTTNVILDVDDDVGTATASSYFTVLQAVPGALALQPIVAGRYEDRFERVGGTWRFCERRKFIDLEGDLSEHLMWSPTS